MNMIPLSSLCQINPRASTSIGDAENVTFLPMSSVSEQGYVNNEEKRTYGEVKKGFTYFERGDVLVAKITPCMENGKVALVEGTHHQVGFGSTEFHVLRPNPDTDPKFLFHSIWNPRFRFFAKKAMRGAAGQKRVAKEFFDDYEVIDLPLKEQKRIATILDKADAIRRKRQQAIDLADEFLRSTFLEMFGDPVVNPKQWQESNVSEVVAEKLQNGAYFPKERYSDDGAEMVHMGDAFYDYVIRGELRRVRASDKDIEKYRLTPDDLLISRRSLTYEGAAKPCLIPESSEPLIFESSMIRLTPNAKKARIRYLFHYLSHPLVKDHFVRKYVTGATIKGISQSNLEQVRLLLPPLELQGSFVEVVERVEGLVQKLLTSTKLYDDLFGSLSHRAFTGEL